MTTIGIVEVLVRIAWLFGAACFVIGLMRMNSPATARNGNRVSAGGMTVAVVATAIWLLAVQLDGDGISATAWAIIAVGVVVGGGLGLYMARTVKMTAMPQLVSLFNAVGGGAAALIAIDDYLGLNAVPSLQVNVATSMITSPAAKCRRSRLSGSPRAMTHSTPSTDSAAPAPWRRRTGEPNHAAPTKSVMIGPDAPMSVALSAVDDCSATYCSEL